MHPETIPLISSCESLNVTDFAVFSSRFGGIVRAEIPTAQSVQFLNAQAFSSMPFPLGAAERKHVFNRVQQRNIPELIDDRSILFPLPAKGDEPLVALVSEIDPSVVKRMSGDWLAERGTYFVEQFLIIKNSRLDPLTNLYNSTLLSEILGAVVEKWKYQVVIIEMRPQARFSKDVLNHVRKVTRSLVEFNRFGFPLFYLGHSLFGCIIFDKERDFLKSFCLSVITFMKDKGFKRIHCGCSALDKDITRERSQAVPLVLGQAWTALHTACSRGPFAFCDYDSLAHPEHFPLHRVSRSTTSKLQRRWKNSESHSLIYFVPDYKRPQEMADVVVRFFGQHNYVMADNGFFVIRCDSTAQASKQWAEGMINSLVKEKGDGFSLSAGISEYPFQRYAKTEIVRNCQKAILHAEFFGYGSVVVFDAVSLNISGDIYYGEGDLAGAAREYRLGLELDGGNINLLNSLGVTYALMNRNGEAQLTFQKVLDQEPANFMALYNRGLGEQAKNNHGAAAAFFLKALSAFNPDDTDDPTILTELYYHLGSAYFHNHEYAESLEWLEKWYNKQDDSKERGKSCRPIGMSYFQLGRTTEAMTWLQRALAYDEDDAEALSTLGTLYLVEKEGNDIALKFMEKSLELESGNRHFMLRYAKGLNECGRYTEAAAALSECRKSRKLKAAAWFELSLSYKGLKKYNKMRYYLKKLLENKETPPDIKAASRSLYLETAEAKK